MNKIIKKLIWLIILAPVVYLAIIWKSLPETVAMHFDLQGNANRYGSKNELWFSAALLAGISAGVYLLILEEHDIGSRDARFLLGHWGNSKLYHLLVRIRLGLEEG